MPDQKPLDLKALGFVPDAEQKPVDWAALGFVPDAPDVPRETKRSLGGHAWEGVKTFVSDLNPVPMLKSAAMTLLDPIGYPMAMGREWASQAAENVSNAQGTGGKVKTAVESLPGVGPVAEAVDTGEYGQALGHVLALAKGPKVMRGAFRLGRLPGEALQSSGRQMLTGLMKVPKSIAGRVRDASGSIMDEGAAKTEIADRMLRNGYGASRRGMERANTTIENAMQARQSAVDAADAASRRANVDRALEDTDRTMERARENLADHQSAINDVEGVRASARSNPRVTPRTSFPTQRSGPDVTRALYDERGRMVGVSSHTPLRQVYEMGINDAQRSATEMGTDIRKQWGKRSDYSVEAEKDLIHGLNEEVSNATGGLSRAENRVMSETIPVRDAIEMMLGRTGNNHALGLSEVVGLAGRSKAAVAAAPGSWRARARCARSS